MISRERAQRIRAEIERHAETLPDETALEVVEMFPKWTARDYAVDERVRWQGILYRCIQAHSENDTWNPADAPSLWARVLIPDPEVIPEWVQPDSTNPYMRGDKVTHNGRVWESAIDNNVWEPGAVGTETVWIEVTA